MAFPSREIAAAYALNVVPRLRIAPNTRLELYPQRPFRSYRIFVVRVKRPNPQLSLFTRDGNDLRAL